MAWEVVWCQCWDPQLVGSCYLRVVRFSQRQIQPNETLNDMLIVITRHLTPLGKRK